MRCLQELKLENQNSSLRCLDMFCFPFLSGEKRRNEGVCGVFFFFFFWGGGGGGGGGALSYSALSDNSRVSQAIEGKKALILAFRKQTFKVFKLKI